MQETLDGFQLRKTKIELPLDNANLDENVQWDLLICHLFVNQRSPVSSITRIGLDYQRVVRTLIEQGMIWDRRQSPGRGSSSEKRPANAA
jgi:hypothetical protein